MFSSLKKEKDFNLVFKKGAKIYSSGLTLVYVKSTENKVGFCVGKKYGGSVTRNRIKRLLREAFRSFSLETEQNFFFAFVPKIKENKDDYSVEEFKNCMRYIFKKGGFIN